MADVRRPKATPKAVARPELISLDAYRALVRRVMQDAIAGESGANRVFSNSGIEHAKIVLEVMLENAHERVDIFSHHLGRAVWQPKWFQDLMERKKDFRVQIVVDHHADIDSDHSALSELKDLIASKQITWKRCMADIQAPHVTIVDGLHVRLERDHSSKQAAVAFGVTELGQAASKMFDTVWSLSEAA